MCKLSTCFTNFFSKSVVLLVSSGLNPTTPSLCLIKYSSASSSPASSSLPFSFLLNKLLFVVRLANRDDPLVIFELLNKLALENKLD